MLSRKWFLIIGCTTLRNVNVGGTVTFKPYNS